MIRHSHFLAVFCPALARLLRYLNLVMAQVGGSGSAAPANLSRTHPALWTEIAGTTALEGLRFIPLTSHESAEQRYGYR